MFFPLVFSLFSRNKTLCFLAASFVVLLLREKQKKSSVSPYLENEEKTSEQIGRNVFLSI